MTSEIYELNSIAVIKQFCKGFYENNDIFLDASGSLAFSQGKQACADIATNKTRTLYGEVLFRGKGA